MNFLGIGGRWRSSGGCQLANRGGFRNDDGVLEVGASEKKSIRTFVAGLKTRIEGEEGTCGMYAAVNYCPRARCLLSEKVIMCTC